MQPVSRVFAYDVFLMWEEIVIINNFNKPLFWWLYYDSCLHVILLQVMAVFNYLIYLIEVVSFKALYLPCQNVYVCYINCRVDCCFGRRERWSFSLKLKKTIKWEVQERECLTFCEEKSCLHWSQLKLNLDHKSSPTCESSVRRLLQALLTVSGERIYCIWLNCLP